MLRYQILPFGSTGKFKEACHCLHLAKIQGMKSISKPRLPIEIYTFQEIMSIEEFRKERSTKGHQKSPENGRMGPDLGR